MRKLVIILTTLYFLSCNTQNQNGEQEKTELITQSDSNLTKQIDTVVIVKEPKQEIIYKIVTTNEDNSINLKDIKKLSEPLKALVALYAAFYGTNCDGTTCELTSALGLGNQGSDEHKNLIKKYFLSDRLADEVIIQDCYLAPSGARSFSEYGYLTIIDIGDSVKVNYTASVLFNHDGDGEKIIGKDTYIFKDNLYTNIQRIKDKSAY
ncbi:MAG: hypothetical protein IT275_03950 [Chitinophagales bacterium]|nr:hypothetical protein [Chitinophagales bacterium]